MISLILLILILFAASSVIGQALFRVIRANINSDFAPLVGFALSIAIAAAVIRLPGHGLTAFIFLTIVSTVAIAFLRFKPSLPGLWLTTAMVTCVVAFLIPFLANDRFGVIGVTFNDDIGAHLAIADALRNNFTISLGENLAGYPIGPHSLAGTLSLIPGVSLTAAFTAIMILVPVLTASSVFAAFKNDIKMFPLAICATVTAATYLSVSYYAEAAFKETIEGLLVLGSILLIREIIKQDRLRFSTGVVLGLVIAAMVLTYGPPGVAWTIGGISIWIVLEYSFLKRLPVKSEAIAGIRFVSAAAVTGVVFVLPLIDRILSFSATNAAASTGNKKEFLGNLVEPIPFYEIFGVWPGPDFRLDPTKVDPTILGVLVGATLLLALVATVRWLTGRDFSVPSLFAAGVLIYLVTRHLQGPYVTAKTLVVIAPVAVLLVAKAVLDLRPQREHKFSFENIALAGAAVFYIGFSLWSSGLVLRHAPVAPLTSHNDLADIREEVKGKEVLFIGAGNFAGWDLFGSKFSMPNIYAILPHIAPKRRPGKPFYLGTAIDFDSIDSESIDDYQYAVITRSLYTSVPSSNWQPVLSTKFYTLWKRTSETSPRITLDENENPGRILDCSSPSGRRISRIEGTAYVRPAPTVARAESWTLRNGTKPIFLKDGVALVAQGREVSQNIRIPKGTYELSLRYSGSMSATIILDNKQFRLPANLTTYGAYFRLGNYRSYGLKKKVTVIVDKSNRLGRHLTGQVGMFAAVPDKGVRSISLSEACGQYVDWYEVDSKPANQLAQGSL